MENGWNYHDKKKKKKADFHNIDPLQISLIKKNILNVIVNRFTLQFRSITLLQASRLRPGDKTEHRSHEGLKKESRTTSEAKPSDQRRISTAL